MVTAQISIIICTLNREAVLCETLRRVAALIKDRDDAELIVVDQTQKHQDATEQCLTELGEVMQLHRVEFTSLTRARNYGIRQAVGEIILFLDDDVEPSPNLIDEHLACFVEPDVWGVGGCTLLPGKAKLSRADLSSHELANLKSGRTNRFDLDWPRLTTWAPGCNMSFRRDKLFEVGGFDEAFYGMAIGEETELCYRIRNVGGLIAYSPSAELVHLVEPTGGCRDARIEDERTAQMLDNANYMLRKIEMPWLERWRILIRQSRTIAFNKRTMREWTWFERCASCISGLRRALRNRDRQPILPLSAKTANRS